MERRGFLKAFLAILGSAATIAFLYPFVRFLETPEAGAQAKKIVIPKSKIPPGDAEDIIFANAPAIVINRPDKGFIALSKVCTHLGCIVQYQKDRARLFCPCHAGVFTLDGKVVSGPPPRPLPMIPLKVEGENIIVG